MNQFIMDLSIGQKNPPFQSGAIQSPKPKRGEVCHERLKSGTDPDFTY